MISVVCHSQFSRYAIWNDAIATAGANPGCRNSNTAPVRLPEKKGGLGENSLISGHFRAFGHYGCFRERADFGTSLNRVFVLLLLLKVTESPCSVKGQPSLLPGPGPSGRVNAPAHESIVRISVLVAVKVGRAGHGLPRPSEGLTEDRTVTHSEGPVGYP